MGEVPRPSDDHWPYPSSGQVSATVPRPGTRLEFCQKALARQRARDLSETASALLAKDKQIAALQRECRELQARLTLAGKVRGGPDHPIQLSPTQGHLPGLWDVDRDVNEMQMKREGGGCWGVVPLATAQVGTGRRLN